ncbi:hypothetical protein H0H93_000908 [Arthromyces matolae]|nr:hypothetical protein H0H93_000908 [Arthromyces matolae]
MVPTGELRLDHERARDTDRIKVADHWITLVTFSPWVNVEKGKCEACIACGCADGSVKILTITQSLASVSSGGFVPTYSVKHSIHPCINEVVAPDKRHLSTLTWIVCKETRITVACKPGTITLVAPPSTALSWFGARTISLDTHRVSAASSPLHPATGVHYVQADDTLIVCFSDGSIHVIHHISSDPGGADENNDLNDGLLTETLRQAFAFTKEGKIKHSDVNRISGLLPYGSPGSLLWCQE